MSANPQKYLQFGGFNFFAFNYGFSQLQCFGMGHFLVTSVDKFINTSLFGFKLVSKFLKSGGFLSIRYCGSIITDLLLSL